VHPFDHVLLLLFAVVQPVASVISFRRYVARGPDPDRVRLYRRTLALEWSALAVLSAGWMGLGRSGASLGFVAPAGAGFWAGAALVLLLIAVLVQAWRSARRLDEAGRRKQISALGKLVHFLPRTGRDYGYFALVSVTAGIVEEVVYRGFLLWYLSLHLPLWAAVLVSSVIFGAGHSYQGPAAALRTGLAGLAFAILYVVSGSIWLPIVAHAAVDLLQGAMIFEVLRGSPEAPGPETAGAPATRAHRCGSGTPGRE
jgi:uncharacterized protein